MLFGRLGLPTEGVNYKIAGINHMAWLLEVSRDGEDLYPIIRKKAVEGPIYDVLAELRKMHPEFSDMFSSLPDKKLEFSPDDHDDMVRFELMKQFGYYVTESSEHSSEYYPYFIKNIIPNLLRNSIFHWMNIPAAVYSKLRCGRNKRKNWCITAT